MSILSDEAPLDPSLNPELKCRVQDTLMYSLRPASLGLTVLYCLLSFLHLQVLGPQLLIVLFPLSALSALACFTIYLLLRSERLPKSSAKGICWLISFITLSNSITHLYMDGDPMQATNLALIVIGFGFLVPDILFVAVVNVAAQFGYGLVAASHFGESSEEWTHFGVFLLIAGLISVTCSYSRSKALHRLLSLQLIREDQNEALHKANEEITLKAKQIEKANQAKSDFLAVMSHEVRTPMNGILGMADVILRSDLPAAVQNKVEIIKESGATLLSLLNDILDLSKIEAGKVDLEMTEVDIKGLLDSATNLSRGMVEGKGLWLRKNVKGGLIAPWLIADPTRIHQVVSNLLSNAAKFTEEGGITLTLSQRETTDGMIETRIEVADTGIGISEEKQSRVFEAFEQEDRTITRRYGGSGLGLSICAELTALMGGDIGVSSKPGEGSCFWFTIVTDKCAGRPDHADHRMIA